MDLPCEKVIWNVLPAVRANLACKLNERGLNQKEIAEKLDLTPSSISRYLKGRRGKKVQFPPEIEELLEEITSDLIENQIDVSKKICRACSKIRTNREVCTRCEIPYENTAINVTPALYHKLENMAKEEEKSVEECIWSLVS